jgi:hypothetical protein
VQISRIEQKKEKRAYFLLERQLTVKVCTLMRELEVLGDGHLKLDFADLREVFQTAMAQQACQASEVGRFCYLLQARYCRA